MNRRHFFKLLAGAAIAPVIAKVASVADAAPLPQLWADGLHDDAPALNALFRGDVVEWMGAGEMPVHVERGEDGRLSVWLGGGTYLTQSTIVLGDGIGGFRLSGAHFKNVHEGHTLYFRNAGATERPAVIENCIFEHRPPKHAASFPVAEIAIEDSQPLRAKPLRPSGYQQASRITAYQRGRA